MADRPKRIKSYHRGASKSLALRVLYGSLVLLGLPLLLHTLFMYRREYQINMRDAFEMVHSLTESRVFLIEQMIHNQQNILASLADDLPSTREEKDAFLKDQVLQFEIETVLYVEIKSGKFLCDDILCVEPSFLPFLQEAIKKDRFVFINPFSATRLFRLFVGQTLPSAENPQGLLLIGTKSSHILDQLTHLEDSPYPLSLSLIDESGLIFLSTEKGLTGRKIDEASEGLSWERYKKKQNAWYLKSLSDTYLAIKIPIQGTGYMMLATTPESSIADLHLRDYLYRIGSFLLIVCIIGGGVVFWLTQRIAKPLRTLGDVMQRISEGAVHLRFKRDPMGFEINQIGFQLNQMLDALFAHQQEAQRERIIRERLAQELKIGHEIQASMLPKHLPELRSLDLASSYLAAREVSGDFYDFFIMEDSRLLIAVADAADKGISACLYSLSFRSMLRTAAATKKDLASIVKTANDLFRRDAEESSFFITAWIGLFDPATRTLQFCSQGHPPAYLRTNTKIKMLSTSGMALGIGPIEPLVQEIQLHENDLLILYTDGVIEAHDSDRQLFGKERFSEFLLRCKANSAQEIVDQLLEEVHLFCNGVAQADDLTILAILQK